MKSLPRTSGTLVLRTYFGEDDSWQTLCDELRRSSCEGYVAPYTFVSDPVWADFPTDRAAAFSSPPYYYLIVDRMTLEHPEHPVLAVNLGQDEEEPRTFRLVPAQVSGFLANMDTANMWFFEFAQSVDTDGIFRGFASPSR
jgi:hypothetical protein